MKCVKGQCRPNHTREGQGWCIPRTIQRFGGKLFAQQLWCWGRDIERADGNQLIQFGFEQYRDCETEDRSTCYRLDHDKLHVSLWGFGMFFGLRELGGLYLGRFKFAPEWAPIESISLAIHWPDELPVFTRPNGRDRWRRARKLWDSMLSWIADYERWVMEAAGIAYRRNCVDSWLRPYVRSDQMSGAWRFLSQRGWAQASGPIHQSINQFTFH